MKCPDCDNALRGDGSCCDYCGWTMVGGGDDPRLPSQRSREVIERETTRRSVRRSVALIDQAGALMREAIATISTLPDKPLNQKLHSDAIAIEERLRVLEGVVSLVNR